MEQDILIFLIGQANNFHFCVGFRQESQSVIENFFFFLIFLLNQIIQIQATIVYSTLQIYMYQSNRYLNVTLQKSKNLNQLQGFKSDFYSRSPLIETKLSYYFFMIYSHNPIFFTFKITNIIKKIMKQSCQSAINYQRSDIIKIPQKIQNNNIFLLII
ncbi:hypothetical protein pb186bvf_007291 [Paramecium bursaria]